MLWEDNKAIIIWLHKIGFDFKFQLWNLEIWLFKWNCSVNFKPTDFKSNCKCSGRWSNQKCKYHEASNIPKGRSPNFTQPNQEVYLQQYHNRSTKINNS